MPMIKRPPKGYFKMEYPLPHNFEYKFSLTAYTVAKTATMVTICRTSNDHNAPSSIETHPNNTNFAEETGTLVKLGSIVPKIHGTLHMQLSNASIQTDQVPLMNVYLIPIVNSFKTLLEASDKKSGSTVQQLLEILSDDTKEDVTPIFNVTDLTGLGGNQPVSTINKTEVLGDFDLTGDTSMEGIDFTDEAIYDTLQYKSNASALRSVMGKMLKYTLTPTHPFANVPLSKIMGQMDKRGLEYGYNGFIVWVPQGGTVRQPLPTSELTAVDHVHFTVSPRYDEWHNGHNSEEM